MCACLVLPCCVGGCCHLYARHIFLRAALASAAVDLCSTAIMAGNENHHERQLSETKVSLTVFAGGGMHVGPNDPIFRDPLADPRFPSSLPPGGRFDPIGGFFWFLAPIARCIVMMFE